MPHFWMRHESRSTERRAPLTPQDAAELIAGGASVTVEKSPQRIFGDDEYAAAGCTLAPTGAWPTAPDDAYVLGLKELPDSSDPLRHRHIFFGHAYKGQDGARDLLERFEAGGGRLLDIEYLTDEGGRRVVAFGYWAGYVGAALGVLQLRGRLPVPLAPTDKAALDALLRPADGDPTPAALVVGAKGRSGRGAVDALASAAIDATQWDLAETRDLDKAALLDHALLVNCVVTSTPQPPFVTDADLDGPRRLRMIADVTCDVTSANNMLPVNTSITTWDRPVRVLRDEPRAEVIAIDNLPSLLPREASVTFSADLLRALRSIESDAVEWRATSAAYDAAVG
ncbi:saccharopine dehydrogenase [Cumulibacter manganitolerans]|uniref:saccharopine dehydrogenase n=1 Tax=Cumulibacter manganitolerans TaxID=1884992 RepID=UPI001E4A8C7A|nr:saccharopine dehydrogenase [Cumulibacter manganitolerans]